MQISYDSTYVAESIDNYKKAISGDHEVVPLSIEVDGGFGEPPLLESFRFMSDTTNLDLQDRITRYCVLGKNVKFLREGKELFSFRINSLADAFEAFPGFAETPSAYSLMVNCAVAYVIKKHAPSLRKNPASETAQKSAEK